MNREEYFKFHEEMTRRMNEITRAKNADYTGAAGDDPFANFDRVESLGVCGTEQGFMVRILDKYMRINSFVQKGFLNVKDESVEDTLLDLANYCLLFAGYLKSKKAKTDSQLPKKTRHFLCSICANLIEEGVSTSHLTDLEKQRGNYYHLKCKYGPKKEVNDLFFVDPRCPE